jgi:hypothetical protein
MFNEKFKGINKHLALSNFMNAVMDIVLYNKGEVTSDLVKEPKDRSKQIELPKDIKLKYFLNKSKLTNFEEYKEQLRLLKEYLENSSAVNIYEIKTKREIE